MGVETALILSAAATGYGIYSQEQAGFKAGAARKEQAAQQRKDQAAQLKTLKASQRRTSSIQETTTADRASRLARLRRGISSTIKTPLTAKLSTPSLSTPALAAGTKLKLGQ